MEPVGPSPWHNPNTGDAVRPLTIPEIREIQKLFVTAAKRLWIAGYDGVEVHAANGYLFQQFFTPRLNHRTDQYGGSIDNRMRLLLETIDQLKDAIPELSLIVRLSVSEFIEGGYSTEEAVHLAKTLEQYGVDAIDLSGGSNESPQLSKYCIQPPSFARSFLVDLAKPFKQVLNIPVMVAGRIVDPADAERMLQEGSADFVSVGRALYADPHWCKKAFGQLNVPIRSCIACNVCFERLTLEKDVSCVQNPMIGTEFEALEFAEPQLFNTHRVNPARVLVLGAGVSGIEAARVLAARGHEVEVWESANRPGGQIHLAVAAPDKTEVWPVWTYRWESIQALGVPVRLGIQATEAGIKAYNPDFIVVATGASPAPPPIKVDALDRSVKVIHAWDALSMLEQFTPEHTVTIIGGGMVGAEVADSLRIIGCEINLLEMQPSIANGMARNNRFELIERLQADGVNIVTGCRIDSLLDKHCKLTLSDGKTCQLEIGHYLIFATGPRPNLEVMDIVTQSGIAHARIGDCNVPGDFLTGIRDAGMVAMSVDNYARRQAFDNALKV
jgi:NADH dehydrogenase FAD-containing subunit